jgi:hypothetical protein
MRGGARFAAACTARRGAGRPAGQPLGAIGVERGLPAVTALRLFLHVTGGAAWIFAGVGLLWVSRRGDAFRPVGDALASVASVALVTVLATGIRSAMASGYVDGENSALLAVKLLAALVSFSAGWLHHRSDSQSARAAWAGTLVVAGLVALYLGVALDALQSPVTGSHTGTH